MWDLTYALTEEIGDPDLFVGRRWVRLFWNGAVGDQGPGTHNEGWSRSISGIVARRAA